MTPSVTEVVHSLVIPSSAGLIGCPKPVMPSGSVTCDNLMNDGSISPSSQCTIACGAQCTLMGHARLGCSRAVRGVPLKLEGPGLDATCVCKFKCAIKTIVYDCAHTI